MTVSTPSAAADGEEDLPQCAEPGLEKAGGAQGPSAGLSVSTPSVAVDAPLQPRSVQGLPGTVDEAMVLVRSVLDQRGWAILRMAGEEKKEEGDTVAAIVVEEFEEQFESLDDLEHCLALTQAAIARCMGSPQLGG